MITQPPSGEGLCLRCSYSFRDSDLFDFRWGPGTMDHQILSNTGHQWWYKVFIRAIRGSLFHDPPLFKISRLASLWKFIYPRIFHLRCYHSNLTAFFLFCVNSSSCIYPISLSSHGNVRPQLSARIEAKLTRICSCNNSSPPRRNIPDDFSPVVPL